MAVNVRGSLIDTTPATNKASVAGLGGALVGLAGAVWAAVAKDPNTVHWAGILGGALVTGTGVAGTVLAHVRGLEAEAQHAIAVVESDVKKVDPTFDPATLNSQVRVEVAKVLSSLAAVQQVS